MEVEKFDYTVNDNNYQLSIHSTEINTLIVYYARISLNNEVNKIEYRDHNGMVYYFTDKELLKESLRANLK